MKIAQTITAKKIQEIITAIAKAYCFDLSQDFASLSLDLSPSLPLIIEKIGRHKLWICQYEEVKKHLIPKQDIVFFTGYADWIPLETNQTSIYFRSCGLNITETQIENCALELLECIVSFSDTWADELIHQQWILDGQTNPKVKTTQNYHFALDINAPHQL